jgi:hypothetical protein
MLEVLSLLSWQQQQQCLPSTVVAAAVFVLALGVCLVLSHKP